MSYYIIPKDKFQEVLNYFSNVLQSERYLLGKLKEKDFYNKCNIRFGENIHCNLAGLCHSVIIGSNKELNQICENFNSSHDI